MIVELPPDRAARLFLQAVRNVQLRTAIFSPDQARDEHGRWTREGGFTASPSDALHDLSVGRKATVSREDVRETVEHAVDKPGPIDLTNLSVEGTPLFVGGTNIPRDKMPQITGEHQQQFLTSLKERGIKVTQEHVKPTSLRPTQSEIDAVRVGQMMRVYDSGEKRIKPIMASSDNYVLDGHHGWAATTIVDFDNPKANIRIPIYRIGVKHEKALDLMRAYSREHKIANRALGGPGSGNFGHEGRPGEVGGSGQGWTNPAHKTAEEISGVKSDVPLKTYTAYHVTRRENVESILKNGFDLNKVEPRWQNDYAVSLSRGEKAAREYFSKIDLKTGKVQSMSDKYALLEVKVKGRLFKGSGFDSPVSYASSPRDWTHQLIKQGLDGQDQGSVIYVNNPRAITSIREVTKPRELSARMLGGPGSGNFGHEGRPGAVGGSGAGSAEHEQQQALVDTQTNPLAHPDIVIGMPSGIDTRDVKRYVAAYGQEFKAASLPDDIDRGAPKQCYKNASLLVMTHPELTYAEGYAQTSKLPGMTFMHAWAVTKDGTVVDPTWDNPEHGTYFGVKYERMPYLKSLYKNKIYGVLGAERKVVTAAIKTGGSKLRALGDVPGHEFHGNQWTAGQGGAALSEEDRKRIEQNNRYYGEGKWREEVDEQGQRNIFVQSRSFRFGDEGGFKVITSGPYKPEERAVKNYIDKGYKTTNSGLRAGDESHAVPELDRLIGRNTIEQEATLYRVVGPSALRGLKEGDVFEDKGYVSTTWLKATAERLAQEGVDPRAKDTSEKHIVHIDVSKGQHAFEVEQYVGRDYGETSEREFLLPRGMQFTVNKVDSEGRVTHIKAIKK